MRKSDKNDIWLILLILFVLILVGIIIKLIVEGNIEILLYCLWLIIIYGVIQLLYVNSDEYKRGTTNIRDKKLVKNKNSKEFEKKVRLKTYKDYIDESFNLLHQKLSERKNIYKPGFNIPANMEARLDSKIYDEKDIEEIAKLMMLKIGVFTNLVTVKTVWIKDSNEKINNAGTFQKHSLYNEVITIKCKKYYSKYVVLSIIAHEVSHAFLDLNKIKYDDVIANEILTDTCAIYLGFGEIMKIGYRKFPAGENRMEKVGYLEADEVEYALKKVNYERDVELTREVEKDSLKNNLSKINKLIILNNKRIDFIKNNLSSIAIKPEDALAVKNIFEEEAIVNDKIARLNKEYDEKMIINYSNESEEILTKMLEWNNILQKYTF